MNNESVEKMVCSKCGTEMLKSQRCCLRCGQLNYSLAQNSSMMQYASQNNNNMTGNVNTGVNSNVNFGVNTNMGINAGSSANNGVNVGTNMSGLNSGINCTNSVNMNGMVNNNGVFNTMNGTSYTNATGMNGVANNNMSTMNGVGYTNVGTGVVNNNVGIMGNAVNNNMTSMNGSGYNNTIGGGVNGVGYANTNTGTVNNNVTATNNNVNNNVGGNNNSSPDTSSNSGNYFYADKAGSKGVCLLVNIVIFIVSVILTGFSVSFATDSSSSLLTNTSFVMFLIGYAVATFEFISRQFMYMKANRPWWSIFIPIYNVYVEFDIAMGANNKFMIFLLCLILSNVLTIFGMIFAAIALILLLTSFVIALINTYHLGKVFGKNGILFVFFQLIYVPIIAFSPKTTCDGICYTTNAKYVNIPDDIKKKNSKKMIIAGVIGVVVCILAIVVCFNFSYFKGLYMKAQYRSFIKDAKIIAKDFERDLTGGQSYHCSRYGSSPSGSLNDYDVFYIKFDDAGKEFNNSRVKESPISKQEYSGHFKVVNNSKIYMTMSDGIVGFDEILVSDLDDVKIIDKPYVITLGIDGPVCSKLS